MAGTGFGKNGYGATSESMNPCTSTESDPFLPEAVLVKEIHKRFITQIRQHTDGTTDGPVRANMQIRRSRRRLAARAKSESDFGALLSENVEEMRDQLIKRYGVPHQARFPIVKGISKFSRQQLLVLASIAIVDFTSFCAMSILAPFYPNEAAAKGVPTSLSGFVFSIYALVVFLASPFMGIIVSHVGPKFLLIIGIFMSGVCNILFGLLDRVEGTVVFIVLCLLVRIFEALGAAAFATASFTFVAKIFPDNVGSVLGLLETFVGLGLSVGPAIGGLLYDWGGYGLPFYFLGVLMLLTVPLNMILLPGSQYLEESSLSKGSMVKLLKIPAVVITCLVIAVSANTWAYLDPTLEPHLREFDLSAKQLGLFFLLSSALYAVSSPIWGYIADKMERTWILMVIGLVLSAVALLLIGPAPFFDLSNTIWINVVSLIILGTATAMTILPTFDAILEFAVEGGYVEDMCTYGLISGLWSSMYSLGEVTGPSLGGFLLEHFGFPISASVMAVVCIVLAIVVLIYFTAFHSTCCGGTEYGNLSDQDKMTYASDSGISDNVSSSSVSLCDKDSRAHSITVIVNESTPLLSHTSSERQDFSCSNSSNTTSKPIDFKQLQCPQSQYDFNHSTSFPDVLKTVAFTEGGAVEV